MVFRMHRRAMGLIVDIFRREKSIGKVSYRPQKAAYRRGMGYTGKKLQRSTPEEQGLSSQYLLEFFRQAQEHPTINPHVMMIARHGKVVSECAFSPYKTDVWHVTHSLCKGVTALAIGMLIDSGKLSLDEKLCDIFPGMISPLENPLSFRRQKSITVGHLLTMSSGVDFNEAGSVTSEDWLHDFFQSTVRFEPGTDFAYNSMNTYVLSAVIKEKTGQTLTQFLRPRLFVPLGFGRVHWETCPKGTEKGGWGLYLYPEDMVKLGVLMLQKGVWNGRRLISEEYLTEMTAKQTDTPPDMGEEGYGFQTWMGKRPGSYLFNGILGQNIMVLPDLDMVLVTTGGNDCLFKTSTVISLAERFFGEESYNPGEALPPDRRSLNLLRSYEKTARNLQSTFPVEESRGLFRREELPGQCKSLAGREYTLDPQGARLLPLFTQLLQNNFSTGIEKLSFSIEDGRFFITIEDGGQSSKIACAFGREPIYSEVNVNREAYMVAASASFATDEDNNPVLKVRLPFIEHSNGRSMKIFFYPGGKIALRLWETPDFEELLRDAGVFKTQGAMTKMAGLILRGDEDVFRYAVTRAIAPKAEGSLLQEDEKE